MKASTKPRSHAGQARTVLCDLYRQHPEVFGQRQNAGLTYVWECARGTSLEGIVRDLLVQIDGPKRQRFERAVQRCLDAYVWPSGGQIRAELSRETGRGGTETLSGDEARWRRDYLVSKGWSCQGFGKFKPPEEWAAISKARAADRRALRRRRP